MGKADQRRMKRLTFTIEIDAVYQDMTEEDVIYDLIADFEYVAENNESVLIASAYLEKVEEV